MFPACCTVCGNVATLFPGGCTRCGAPVRGVAGLLQDLQEGSDAVALQVHRMREGVDGRCWLLADGVTHLMRHPILSVPYSAFNVCAIFCCASLKFPSATGPDYGA